ncbi:MAG: 5-(carboxyamino)imidazole ribonucleotide synthase [Gammaproteobacteria bacterium]|nr:5-(carboxyamino)imidazole ribonucleotide synthase [Rhodocyclaceae bacterium]MBU3909641.1 5-(carboxyamino)imidazole ribonucleotide synthase [Gammaproteobacteria bacterium]MBU3987956.1 5-(carboxyamino)imidazole ribonucleotide synthase [Gammaproteobacteria bacterium]MBU4005174.1 5-(carboxyamino)imidazole ribonucleotide synthase [Gammaproteobacteria bacterium]MBU4022353.1 5-(carboxyamino)imidazole ribonucleotide synthase [Gammaproteobacteria bacterium]
MILPPATLGMLGGGQLGRFFVMAAHELGYRVLVLDPDEHSPAGRIADEHLVAAYDDLAALERLTGQCAAVTTEFENVPADTLAYLSKYVTVRPNAEAVRTCQNRSEEKAFLKRHGFPHAPYADIRSEADLREANAGLFPGILKVARFGYDGKGQVRVNNREGALIAWSQLRNEPCVLEQQMKLDYEVSVVLARDEHGAVRCFPTAENSHRRGILDISLVPARTFGCLAAQLPNEAEEIAEGIAQKMDYVGTLGVEFFIVHGQLYVNEMAPRPHNSGHYTIDACVTNQFEQQVRALCGLPLGEARAHSAAAMVNLLGDIWYRTDPHHAHEPDWAQLLAIPNLKLHLYGKRHPRPGRKMGHFTVIGTDPLEVQKSALAGRRLMGISNE